MGSHPESKDPLPAPVTPAGRDGLEAILSRPSRTVVALDFDGTLAPIVPDPDQARAHPGAVPAIAALAPKVASVAVITGRPPGVAVRHGGFAGVPGLEHLVVLGHYGAERWDAVSGEVTAPAPHPGVAAVRAELPGFLDRIGAWHGTWIEEKGRALAVHTRRADHPQAAFEALREPLADLAGRHGLIVEPGRMVLELRPPGMDKGVALLDHVRRDRRRGRPLRRGRPGRPSRVRRRRQTPLRRRRRAAGVQRYPRGRRTRRARRPGRRRPGRGRGPARRPRGPAGLSAPDVGRGPGRESPARGRRVRLRAGRGQDRSASSWSRNHRAGGSAVAAATSRLVRSARSPSAWSAPRAAPARCRRRRRGSPGSRRRPAPRRPPPPGTAPARSPRRRRPGPPSRPGSCRP